MIGGAHHDNETWQELSGSDLDLDGRRWVLIGEWIMDGGWSVCSRTARTPHFHLTDEPRQPRLDTRVKSGAIYLDEQSLWATTTSLWQFVSRPLSFCLVKCYSGLLFFWRLYHYLSSSYEKWKWGKHFSLVTIWIPFGIYSLTFYTSRGITK